MSIRSPRSLIQQVDAARFESLMRCFDCAGPFPQQQSRTYVDGAVLLVCGLGEGRREDFDETLDRISALSEDRGRNAILIAAGDSRSAFDAEFEQHRGPADSALWCLLEHPNVFARAEKVLFGERAYEREHEWVGSFVTDPAPAFTIESLQRERLEEAFVGAYRDRGDYCFGVALTMADRAARAKPDARCVEINIERKGRPETAHVYENDEPVFKRLVPVMPDVVMFTPETGLVEIISRHGDRHRERLATDFCDAALGREPPVRVERLSISFAPLRTPRVFDPLPADGVREVRLFELRTSNGKQGFETIRADVGEDVYACMQRRGTIHLLQGDIDRAAFDVWFADPRSNGKGTPLKLVLAGEDAISFPKWSRPKQAIGRKLLAHWGMIAA